MNASIMTNLTENNLDDNHSTNINQTYANIFAETTSNTTAYISTFNMTNNSLDFNTSEVTLDFCVTEKPPSIVPILDCLLFLPVLIGNGLVLMLFARNIKRVVSVDIYIINLVISDILFALTLPIFAAENMTTEYMGVIPCVCVNAVFTTCLYVHSLSLCCLSVYQYLTAAHTNFILKYHKIMYTTTICPLIWIFAALLAVPDIILFNNPQIDLCTRFTLDKYVLSSTTVFVQLIIGFLCPFVIILASYLGIASSLAYAKAVQRRRAFKFAIIVVMFFNCWFPYNICLLWRANSWVQEHSSCQMEQMRERYAIPLTRSLATINCCLIPYIYVLSKRRFQAQIKAIWSKVIINKD
ncbi:C-X-C chemokine receptor type 4-like [Lampetra fluviatilis]